MQKRKAALQLLDHDCIALLHLLQHTAVWVTELGAALGTVVAVVVVEEEEEAVVEEVVVVEMV